MRKPLSKKLRFKILSKFGYTCVYCGARAGERKLHVDHILPVSKGGTNHAYPVDTPEPGATFYNFVRSGAGVAVTTTRPEAERSP